MALGAHLGTNNNRVFKPLGSQTRVGGVISRQSLRWSMRAMDGPKAPYTATRLTDWEESEERDVVHLAEWKQIFQQADQDRDGLLSKDELMTVLGSTAGGLSPITMEWLADAKVANVMQSMNCDARGGLDFEEFTSLARAGTMLNGKFTEYWTAFQGADQTGNGSLDASELRHLFKSLNHPVSDSQLWKIFEQYDKDENGQIDFKEFLQMFPAQLLDLKEILSYLELHPRQLPVKDRKLIKRMQSIKVGGKKERCTHRLSQSLGLCTSVTQNDKAELGGVTMIFSESELDCLLEAHAERLTVLEASLTWCRPCKGFERTFQKFAEQFPETLFLKFYGNSNADCKHLIEARVQAQQTPFFTFFRHCDNIGSMTGASKGRLYEKLNELLRPEESPLTKMSTFQQQVWRTKLGLG